MTDWIVTSSVLIIVVTALRYLLRGTISLRLQYALWALVLLRLLLPVQLGETSFSVLNAVEEDTELQLTVSRPFFFVGETPDLAMPVVEPDDSLSEEELTQLQQKLELQYYEEMSQYAMPVSLSTVLRVVWLTGTAVTAAWFFLSNLHFARVLRRSRRLTEHTCGNLPVYVSPPADTPCLFGLFHPAVYVTEAVLQDETVLHHVLSHEETHYRQGDHIWSVLRGVCLALHWYNPLVWLAAALSRRDAELACDEGTLRRLGEEQRTAYGETLIALTCGRKKGELLLTATTMTGSKKSLRERITLIAKRPKMAVYTLIAALLVVTVAAGCTFTGGTENEEGHKIPITYAGVGADGQAATDAEDYLRTHIELLQEISPSLVITGGEILSLTPIRLPHDALSPSIPYTLRYRLYAQDADKLSESTLSHDFQRLWGGKDTDCSCPTVAEAYSPDGSGPRTDTCFNAILYAPSQTAFSIHMTNLHWQLPDATKMAAAEYVLEQASAVQQLTGDPSFVTGAKITRLEPISTGYASEFFSVQLYYLDYRLQPRGPSEVNMDLGNLVYSQAEGNLWLREDNSNGTPILAMECRTKNGITWSRLGIFSSIELEQLYGGDYTEAARGIYESARNSTH